MRVTRVARTESLRRALGEVFLIVIGILLALAATDWADRREEREREREILEEIREALNRDVSAIDSVLAIKADQRDRIGALHAHMRDGGGYADTLDAAFGVAYVLRGVRLNRAAFESLKSQGLDLVSDSKLRSALAHVYERVYPTLDGVMGVEQNIVLEVMRPHFLGRFRDLRFGITATPLDYSDLVGDEEFLNILDYRRTNLSQAVVPAYESAAGDLRELIGLLDDALGDAGA